MAFVFAPPATPSLAIQGEERRFPIRRVYCVGKNYAAHVAEMGDDPNRSAPFFFAKPADAIDCAPQSVPYPPATTDLHHEVELVIALDAGGSDLSPAQARELIFGYAVGVDLTRRDLQAAAKKKGEPWVTSKGFDHSAPVSAVRPLARTIPAGDTRIWLRVNDELRQDGKLGAMIWPVAELLANLSQYFTLAAGDLIFTGTPAGVGALQIGDRVACGVDGVGELNFAIGDASG